MPAIMDERAGRDFMIISKQHLGQLYSLKRNPVLWNKTNVCRFNYSARFFLNLLIGLVLLFTSSCSPELVDDPIPPAVFDDIVINLTLPEFNGLNAQGYHYIGGNAGVRGLILHKKSPNEYLVFERNCSYQPNSACATVEVHSSTLFMQDACCGSIFNWDGNPTGGPAWRPLRQYVSYLNGTVLTITDEIEIL
jgi:hypothetical protein